jgi:signal transduction histidine kinase
MHLPRLPNFVASDTDSTPPESASGFWPLGATGRARILSHTIDPAAEAAASAYLTGIRRQLESVSDPVGFFTNLFANAPIGCSILNADGHVFTSNSAAHRLFGGQLPPDYNVFTDYLAIEHGIVPAIDRALMGETVSLPAVWYDLREYNNASVFVTRRAAISVTVFPILNAAHSVDYVALMYRDDTQIALAQQQLKAQCEQLEQQFIGRITELEEANEELEAFSYSVSHDLRAPLRAIDAFATLLALDDKSQMSTDAQDSLRRIRSATGRMSDLINDLLSFSQLGKQALTLKTVSTMTLVRQVLQELEPKLHDRAVNIQFDKLPMVRADAALLREVFLNLLDNAIKFTAKNPLPRIEVGTRILDDRLVWYVSDNGVGFDMNYYSRLFDVFSRLHSNDEFEGTGVGLALVQRIVKRHGGKVWAHSELGNGATFYFTLGH